MSDSDPFATQRDTAGSVAAELMLSGFDDAHEIGRGGFGVVYRCTEPSLDRTVAVKVLTADLDEQNRKRFFREQRAAGRLTGHPNIVNILQTSVTHNGRPFIVLPYYAHGSLDSRIRRHALLPLKEVLRIGVKIAGALESAHRFEILHRDVKPGNILLNDYGEPALADFGIAHFAGSFETETGVVTGSPAFIAPEVVSGGPPSSAADVYGLGATLFAALTGHVAFERRSGEKLVTHFLRIASESVPDPREYGVSEDVSAVIERAMSREPTMRPSAEEFGHQLRDAQHRHGLPVDEMSLYSAPKEEQSLNPASAELSVENGCLPRGQQEAGSAVVSERSGGLPLELTSFVDRRKELAEAKNLLTTSRLVTLTGIGGVGKTRLALRIATKTRHIFFSDVRLVELGELRDGTLLTTVVAGALGLKDRSARPVEDVLVEFLAARNLLLLLDNCEQVIAEVAKLTEFLLRNCPDLKILATSREPVGISGEVVLLVPPLAVADPDRLPRGIPRNDAINLFVDRGMEAVPGFELADEDKAVVARICRQLDGLPLPIELAAARLRVMSPEQILQRLTERYALLTQGHRGAPSRQQTLRMCIDWSYDLCAPVERAVWAQLSVFAGGFELDAAEKVCGGDLTSTEVLDAVACLVEKSILVREPSGKTVRFRMLETLREYGREKAQSAGEFTEIRRRHRDWCEQLSLAAEAGWVGPRQLEWIAIVDREQFNVREALEFCVSDSPDVGVRITMALLAFWISQGAITEGRRWLTRSREAAIGTSTIEQAKAIYASSLTAAIQADFDEAWPLIEMGRALAGKTSDPLLHAYVDHAEGDVALFSGNLVDARSHLTKAVQRYAEQGVLHFKIMAMLTLGMTLEQLSQTDQAVEYYERVLAITEARGETMYRSYSLWALAVAVLRQNDRDRAVRLLDKALRLGREVNDRLNISMCLQASAWIAVQDKDSRRAAVLMGASERVSRSVGSSRVLLPGLLEFHETCEREVRQSLGDRDFRAAFNKGAALRFHSAIDYALREQQRAPTKTPASLPSTRPTKRELEVAELIAEGLSNKEIAARLVISPRTAQGHVEHLLVKLGFTSRAQIAVWVVESRGDNGEQHDTARP